MDNTPAEKPSIYTVKFWVITFTLPVALIAFLIGMICFAVTIGFAGGWEYTESLFSPKEAKK